MYNNSVDVKMIMLFFGVRNTGGLLKTTSNCISEILKVICLTDTQGCFVPNR